MHESNAIALRRAVELRAQGRCEYCHSQARFATQSYSLEHITPRSRGGETSLSNLAFACQGCNNHKYNRTAALDGLTKTVVPLYHPRQQRWQEQFTWDDRFEQVIGLTATGRATVEALKLNRPELVNLRRLLYAAGEHPLPNPREDSG